MKTSIRASTKKRGRPKTTGKGQQIGVRLLPPDLSRLDAWISEQPEPKPTRPEALRRLASAGFTVSPAPLDEEELEEGAHEQFLKRYRAEEFARKAAAKAAEEAAIAKARSPMAIRNTEMQIAQAKIEDHAVAYLREELGEERFANFVGMFDKIRYANGLNNALWRIGCFVPHVACGALINPETGDIARRGMGNGAAWIETKDGTFKAGNEEAMAERGHLPKVRRRLERRAARKAATPDQSAPKA